MQNSQMLIACYFINKASGLDENITKTGDL
jgi:hypothetical protein